MPKRQITFNKTVEFPALRAPKQLKADQCRLLDFEHKEGERLG